MTNPSFQCASGAVLAGEAAAVLGVVADHQGIDYVFRICSYLPLLGLLTILLPNIGVLRRKA